MNNFHDRRFPGESEAYRAERDKLIAAEIKLRNHIEEVAAQRRDLPMGGRLKEDYVFEEGAADLSDRETVTRLPCPLSLKTARTRLSFIASCTRPKPKPLAPCVHRCWTASTARPRTSANGLIWRWSPKRRSGKSGTGPGKETGGTCGFCRQAAPHTTRIIWRNDRRGADRRG